jgi:hypothetical protein
LPMKSSSLSSVSALQEHGVILPHPESVYIADDVDVKRIAPGVVLHPGTRLLGAGLSIGPGCVIGGETPATVDQCQLSHNVALKGGFFQGSVFLDESSMGSAAHVRPGCLLEEEASGAHAVGLKQTILFPFVTLGSLINFCDVLMAGGRDRKNHSEVGSSFIHFNFTPHGDKATASLIGDVPRGVLADQAPIFLGGQGGIVGPVSMEYGVVQAAGSICRRDLEQPDHLYQSGGGKERWMPYTCGQIRDFPRRLALNLRYIGNLLALSMWYRSFRGPLMSSDLYRKACVDGAETLLADAVEERIRQLEKLAVLVPGFSPESRRALAESLRALAAERAVDADLASMAVGREEGYRAVLRTLTPPQRQQIRERLEHVVTLAVSCGSPHLTS